MPELGCHPPCSQKSTCNLQSAQVMHGSSVSMVPCIYDSMVSAYSPNHGSCSVVL